MRRGRSGIGAELVPLVLILASLAGSLALVIAIHRRFVARSTSARPTVAVVAPPVPLSPRPQPIVVAPPSVEADEPEPPPPPPAEDPTPKVLAKLMAAEADQLLEASKADRKAAALEEARKSALLESERWRRRESLVRLQLDTLETKVHQLETQADEMALERDALEKELDARKALAAQARSRPGTAILPHRGQNGTWRRPIVIECVNGMAILRPQNLGFGLLELALGFGPEHNPFVAAVAREAIRIQGNSSPDGQVVTPYIFFLVRPDGIRTYYEARGRLEPLGITFGYELADQDWEIDFPDLDDTKTWDGSGPSTSNRPDPLAQIRARQTNNNFPVEDQILPDIDSLPGNGTGAVAGSPTARDDGPGSEFTWPPKPRGVPAGNGRVSLGGHGTGEGGSGGIGNSRGTQPTGSPGLTSGGDRSTGGPAGTGTKPYASAGGSGNVRFPGGTSGAVTTDPTTDRAPGTGTGTGDGLTPLPPPRELALGGSIPTLPPAGSTTKPGSPSANPANPPGLTDLELKQPSTGSETRPEPLPPVVSPRNSPTTGRNDPGQTALSDGTGVRDPADPTNSQVFPSPSAIDPSAVPRASSGGGTMVSPDQTPPVRHIGPFSRPLAAGLDPSLIANATPPSNSSAPSIENIDPSQLEGTDPGAPGGPPGLTNPSPSAGSANPPRNASPNAKGSTSASTTHVIGPGDASSPTQASGSPPPPLAVGLGSPGSPPPSGTPPPFGSPSTTMNPPPPSPSNPPRSAPPSTVPPSLPNNFKVVDRTYEIVVVCNARGVIVQPGAYRVTADALKNRDGLFNTQIVALVKAKRKSEPKITIEPKVRFLVQPGGEGTYWTARTQFLLSGLDWPMTTQVAERDRLSILPSEGW